MQKVILTKEKVPTDFKKQGRRNRVNGGIFERKVRADLEKKGWIVNKWMNNVDLIENFFFSHKKEEMNENEERNKIKLYDFSCLNEIQISEKIKKNLPNYVIYFDILTEFSNIKLSSSGLQDTDLLDSAKKHLLIQYSCEKRVKFYDFLLNLPEPKLFIFHIIDSYSYLIRSLIMLNAKNICFFNLTSEKIVFDAISLKPLLHDVEYSLYTRNLNDDYLCKIVDKMDDFSNMPLEIHVIFYLIKNNENTLSYSIISEICDNFVKNTRVLSIFSQIYRDNFKIYDPTDFIIDFMLTMNDNYFQEHGTIIL